MNNYQELNGSKLMVHRNSFGYGLSPVGRTKKAGSWKLWGD